MNKEILKKIVKEINENERWMEDFNIEINGIKYGVTDYNQSDIDDQGKYQYITESGKLCTYTKDWDIVDTFDILISRDIQRSGSYFSDYYYDYENVEVYTINKVIIPEETIVVPEHEEIKYDKIEL